MIGYAIAFVEAITYQCLPASLQAKISEQKLNRIIEYARKNCELYRKRIPENLEKFEDIKPVTKQEIIENFDSIVTNKELKLTCILNHIKEHPGEGQLMHGKYCLSLTSGSTGKPSIVLKDSMTMERDSMASTIRNLHFTFPIATLTDPSGLSVEGAHIKRNMKRFPWLGKLMFNIDPLKPAAELIKEIRECRPYNLIGYTSVIRLISVEMKRQGITLDVKQIFCSGETFTESDKKMIEQAFPRAKVGALYGCTEGGVMAGPCKYGHLHVNTDLVKLEAVDPDYRPVPEGTLSRYTLLTDLSNKIQPLIRYVLDDRIKMYSSCPCGCGRPWVEPVGRTDDRLMFVTARGEVEVAPMGIILIMDEICEEGLKNFHDFQIVHHPGNLLEFRLDMFDNVSREKIFDRITEEITGLLRQSGIDQIKCILSEDRPVKTTVRGKQKRIYCHE